VTKMPNNNVDHYVSQRADGSETRVTLSDRGGSGAGVVGKHAISLQRQSSHCYTDCWGAYQAVISSDQHDTVGKHTGLMNHIERFNLTMIQRVSKLVRRSLSFSKKFENHIGAIWYFIYHHNLLITQTI
jgi:insertion element IS1 protein InsB